MVLDLSGNGSPETSMTREIETCLSDSDMISEGRVSSTHALEGVNKRKCTVAELVTNC